MADILAAEASAQATYISARNNVNNAPGVLDAKVVALNAINAYNGVAFDAKVSLQAINQQIKACVASGTADAQAGLTIFSAATLALVAQANVMIAAYNTQQSAIAPYNTTMKAGVAALNVVCSNVSALVAVANAAAFAVSTATVGAIPDQPSHTSVTCQFDPVTGIASISPPLQ